MNVSIGDNGLNRGEKDIVKYADDSRIMCKSAINENFPLKIEKILEQTDKYLTENDLTLNADKTEMFFFKNHTNSDSGFTFKDENCFSPAELFVS